MKFLQTLVSKYGEYELPLPKNLKEGVNAIPSTGTTSAAANINTPSGTATTAGQQTTDITSMTSDPETLKIKKETDALLKQVATILKKQASDVYNKLRATRTMP